MKLPRFVRFSWRLPAGAILLLTLLAGGGAYLLRSPAPTKALAAEPLNAPVDPAMLEEVTQGALRVKSAEGEVVECPLRHTDVQADISGFIARVTVTQTFYNSTDEKIEAVYVFPLPHTAAVDAMTMVIDDRRIVGLIKRRAEAREIYEQALARGYTAGLLEQERPNIFTQSVGNIKPKAEVKIEISYVDVLAYDMGVYQFHFPMVVGPRYNASAPFAGTPAPVASGQGPAGAMPAEGVNPPVLLPENRNGHDISLSVTLDAGVPVRDMKVVNHKAKVETEGEQKAAVTLDEGDNIPNKDFVLKYSVVGEKPELALLAHAPNSAGGYFMLMMQPRIEKELATAPPREIVFLVDVSGSMSGQPTEKVKETLAQFFKRSKPTDTIQVVTFFNEANKLFDRPVPASPENIAKAMNFSAGYQAGGGTEMLKGIQMVLNEPPDPERVRICVMLTDGYIGNEAEIIQAVGKRAGDKIRFWTLGIGSSPNRFLIDGVANTGGGKSAVLEPGTDPSPIVGAIVERIHRAQLAGVSIDWGGLDVYDVYPRAIPELWAGGPVILFGRYQAGGAGKIELNGMAEGKPLSYRIDVELPSLEPAHDVLAKVWARNKIEDLMAADYYGGSPAVVEEVTNVALDYKLMSQYTSFVAVDERDVDKLAAPAKPPRRLAVPVPIPDGVSFEGVFGSMGESAKMLDYADSFGGRQAASGGIILRGAAPAPPPALRAKMSNNSVNMAKRSVAAGKAMAPGIPPGAAPSPTTAAMPSQAQLSSSSISGAKPQWHAVMGSADRPAEERAGDRTAMTSAGWARPMFEGQAEKRHNDARAALEKAKEQEKAKDYATAFARYQQAYLLEHAALALRPWQNDGTGASARQGMDAACKALAAANLKALPALGNRLELVLSDRTVAQALREIERAAKVDIELLPGSEADACELDDRTELRVSYLDLRGATVAQALDWLLAPYHLSWRVQGRKIVAGSARRLAGLSPWIYRVGDLAVPVSLDQQHPQEAVEKALNALLAGVTPALGKGESAVLLTPDHLLVFANTSGHERVGALLAALKDPKAKVAGAADTPEFRALRGQTSFRWAAREKERAERLRALSQARLRAVLNDFSWQLLAGAAKGETDGEALAELQAAWRGLELPKEADLLIARSAWALSEAVKMLPKDGALRKLAAGALPAAKAQFTLAAGELKDKPGNDTAGLAALYSALALRNAGTAPGAAEDLLTAVGDDPLRVIISSFLAPDRQTDVALAGLITDHRLAGPDHTVLGCLAALRRGGNPRSRLDEELPDLLGGQPLDGNIILIVNRLASKPPSIAGLPGRP